MRKEELMKKDHPVYRSIARYDRALGLGFHNPVWFYNGEFGEEGCISENGGVGLAVKYKDVKVVGKGSYLEGLILHEYFHDGFTHDVYRNWKQINSLLMCILDEKLVSPKDIQAVESVCKKMLIWRGAEREVQREYRTMGIHGMGFQERCEEIADELEVLLEVSKSQLRKTHKELLGMLSEGGIDLILSKGEIEVFQRVVNGEAKPHERVVGTFSSGVCASVFKLRALCELVAERMTLEYGNPRWRQNKESLPSLCESTVKRKKLCDLIPQDEVAKLVDNIEAARTLPGYRPVSISAYRFVEGKSDSHQIRHFRVHRPSFRGAILGKQRGRC